MRDLIDRLELDGVTLALQLRAAGNLTDDHRDLIRDNRDDLIAALAMKRGLHLPSTMLESLMVWTRLYHDLKITRPDGLTLNATPEHVREALETHAWGVVHFTDDGGRWLLLSWGSVPTHALRELKDLDTGTVLVSEQVAA